MVQGEYFKEKTTWFVLDLILIPGMYSLPMFYYKLSFSSSYMRLVLCNSVIVQTV
jgi:hypothetical protein